MTRIEALRDKVKTLYKTENPNRADLADWIYDNHVVVVANYSKEVAEQHGANAELAEAAGLLHDIADAVMRREEDGHEEKSLEIARQYLAETGFTDDEIAIVVDDALRYHSCHGSDAPKTPEGKCVATGDALGHLKTPFYDYLIKVFKERGEKDEEIKEWGMEKIDRDFNKKIFFKDIRANTQADYERLKVLFSNL